VCGSCNRAKSWSCEHCPNGLETKDPKICAVCYWASPLKYTHVATLDIRRLDLTWTGTEVPDYDAAKAKAGPEDQAHAEVRKGRRSSGRSRHTTKPIVRFGQVLSVRSAQLGRGQRPSSSSPTLTESHRCQPPQPRPPPLTLENLLYEKKPGGIAYITLNRPKVLNALNRATWEDLRTAFEDARADIAIRGVILTGAGDKAFIAGADIGELAQVTALEAEESSRFGQEVLNLIENLGKPVIAAITASPSAAGARRRWPAPSASPRARPSSASPRSSLGSCPAGAARSACRGLVGRGGLFSSSSPARSSTPRRRTAHRAGQRSCSWRPT